MTITLSKRLRARFLRADPVLREIVIAGMFLLGLFAIGAVGYHLIEGWPWLDGVYMTFITLTTIGFEEVSPLSSAGRLFTIGLAGIGIGAVAFIATRTAQFLLTNQGLASRRMNSRIAKQSEHYIICGYGRIGSRIAEDLARENRPFVVIENNPEKIERASSDGYLHLLGDAELDETLELAGIRRAKGLILTLPEDSANVFVTLSAKELNPTLFILVRTDTKANLDKLKRAGANKVIAAYDIGADRMANVILRPNVNRFLEESFKSDEFEFMMEEVEIKSGSSLSGQTLAQSQFRGQFGAIVIAILSRDGEMLFNPSADCTINSSDVLIVIGSKETVAKLRRTAAGI